MGKAAFAPFAPSNYTRRYYISSHAVDRLRDRYKKKGDTGYRHTEDLANLIDWAVSVLIDDGDGENVLDENEPAIVLSLGEALREDLWAVVKTNDYTGEYEQAVVTLLEPEQAMSCRRNGKWKAENGDRLPDLSLAKLGDRPEAKTAIQAAMTKINNLQPNPNEKKTPPTQNDQGQRLLQYRRLPDGKDCYELLPRDAALMQASQLRADPNVISIRLWREVKLALAEVED